MATYNENDTGVFTATVVDEADNPVPGSTLDTMKLTLYLNGVGTIINGRDSQNTLNANNVTIDESGNLTWLIQKADNVILDANNLDNGIETHKALFVWTWSSGTKQGSDLNSILVKQDTAALPIGASTKHYGTIVEADSYFNDRLNSEPWTSATNTNKSKSLIEATRLIDALNIKGSKASATQSFEFPRASDTEVPIYIRWATYEIGLKLLDGYDADEEVRNMRASSQSYGGVRSTYSDFALPHLLAGIPSAKAWSYILPYLRDPRELTTSRVS